MGRPMTDEDLARAVDDLAARFGPRGALTLLTELLSQIREYVTVPEDFVPNTGLHEQTEDHAAVAEVAACLTSPRPGK